MKKFFLLTIIFANFSIAWSDDNNASDKTTNMNSATNSTFYNTDTYTITIKGQSRVALVCDNCHLTSLDVNI